MRVSDECARGTTNGEVPEDAYSYCFDLALDLLDARKQIAEQAREIGRLAPLCPKHATGSGSRSGCLVCYGQHLMAALSRIDYLCDEPNEMKTSAYDVHCDEQEVVRHVEAKIAELEEEIERLEAEAP